MEPNLRNVVFPTLPEQPFFCFLESVGWSFNQPDHDVVRQQGALNSFNIHLIISGRGYVEIDGTAHELTAGDAFLYFPKEQQRYYSSKEDPWSIIWVHFYGDKLKEFLVEAGFHRSALWTLKQWSGFETAHRLLLEEAEKHKFLHGARLSTLTYGIIAEFMSQAVPLTASKSTEVADRVTELLPLIQQQAHLPFELQEWADRAGVSVYYFCRLFRKVTHMTPMAFVTLCRLQKAKQLLLERSAWPVKRIAEESGYANASYFNKRFLEQEGLTPTEYRTAHLGLKN